MPLVYNPTNTLGFALQFGDGDQELQLEHIKGFEVAMVYLTSGGPTNTPYATGEILFDKMEIVGNRYAPLETFDNAATGVFTIDDMSWAGSGAGSVTLGNNSTDFVEGTGSMQLNYMVNCSQSWGGYINMTKTLTAPPDSFENRTALVLYIKNAVPHTGTSERLTMRFFVIENNTGTNEDWVCEVPITLDQSSDWTRYYMPLVKEPTWTDGQGHQRFPNNGFAQPWWNPQGDQLFNPDKITAWKIELSGGGNEYGSQGEQFSGTLLFDVLQQSGFQFADHEPPVAPTNVVAVPGTFTNLVTWSDVPNENNEKYFVYASMNPITDLTSPDVDLIASNIAGGVQVVDHLLIAPLTNQNVTYYYAVVCKDFAGNIGAPGFSTATTNVAKGIAVVTTTVPAFVADGNLSEWQSLPKFRMYPSDGTGTICPGYTITNDADCSADAWVAVDQNYLYIAFNVSDDVFYPVEQGLESYKLDSPDLFMGFYNWKNTMHTSYQRGNTPDYHLRFNEGVIRIDNSNAQCDSLLVEGANYYFGENFPFGYIVEAKIALSDLATKRNDGYTGTDVINIHYADRLPIDFGINDNDGTGREGLLFYSPKNNDAGWSNPSVWSYTWLNNWWAADVDNPGAVVNEFRLSQNYPNPFNPNTNIKYSVAQTGLVTIRVYDVLGREVAQLVNEQKAPGSYNVTFDASNLTSGVYLYKMESGSYTESKKMILVK